MAVELQAAQSLAKKLQDFRETLAGGEQEALDGLLRTFAGAARAATSSEGLRTAAADIEGLNAQVRSLTDEDVNVAITPTVTTITITTTLSSHPTITCS